ncbi:ADP-ribose pyrophosphatase [Endozoicomonas montiporae]|uniref:ADP-ribose pyrophosphatase n=2 Tax=Endozoicomonas montiporae TaxID=1027273 RepID=A0A081N0C9_9GAMM|nr:NUDIX domain-containing protein [Endozoicomonas montiporae]AMO54357.1 ADP-ribose pyrophosphatase [Endozoicomonas montiporae CL-33]KEQ11902.1 ADP-ribose pyrophosphatase [Endozoicomonas montiporae]
MKLSNLGLDDVRIDEEQNVYSGFLKLSRYKIRHALFEGGWSPQLEREAVYRVPSVGVLLYDPALDLVVLVEQFRIGPLLSNDDPWLLEVVAGISEADETLESVALREVKEEANCEVKALLPVSNFYVSPGATNERLMLYCGITDASKAGGCYGVEDEGEDIKVHVVPFAEAYAMVKDGRIANAPAVIALQWLKLHHQELQQYA